jgi:hypothetical protein
MSLDLPYIPPSFGSNPSGGNTLGSGFVPALSANVLVLNRFYQAIRVVNVRRALSSISKLTRRVRRPGRTWIFRNGRS